jgi:hypothetical protein
MMNSAAGNNPLLSTGGTWEKTGQRPFPDSEKDLRADQYVWRATDGFEISFLVPEEPGPRRFFCEPVLDAWLLERTGPEAFANEICKRGIPLLADIKQVERMLVPTTDEDRSEVLTKEELEFCLAIFRRRSSGTEALTRRLTGRDLFNRSRGGKPPTCIILPPSALKGDKSAANVVKALEDECFRGVSPDPRSGRTEASRLVYRPDFGPFAALFIDGADRDQPWKKEDWERACRAVSSIVVSGLNIVEDRQFAEANADECAAFRARIREAWRSKSAMGFDRWLKGERQRKWHRLVPQYRTFVDRCRDDVKTSPDTLELSDELRDRASRYYRLLLWEAYGLMAQAFGVVMTIAWIDLVNSELIKPTAEESRIFRQLNLPQPYLACLPLALLPLEPLTWIMRQIVKRMHAGVSNDYDKATYRLLATYSIAVAECRRLDKERKKRAAGAGGYRPRTRGRRSLKTGFDQDQDHTFAAQPDQYIEDPNVDDDIDNEETFR